ncbi:MAG: peptidoglycan DD-metalloendopeptidase family protein [Pseudomonadota bacterium]|nr:peptidoglycan DD-metalloendopeptidase family protein [Pseudomonadota bacterium]
MTILFAQQYGARRGARRCVAVGFLGVAAMAAVAGGAGFWYGQLQSPEQQATGATVAELESMFDRERAALETAKKESLSHLDAIASRVGEMQAEILRLNALGERLVQMADLDAEEFDFENTPPVGGPDEVLETKETSLAELAGELTQMLGTITDRKRKLTELERSIMEKDLKKEASPSGWPVSSGYITSKYGYRKHPIRKRTHFHSGVDFAGKRGTPVVAVADGLVVYSGRKNGYGRMVEVRHMDGLITRYAHNQKNLVKEGELVEQGQTIAKLGSSGRSTGPHVHFEVLKDGKAVNPMKYVGTKKPEKRG